MSDPREDTCPICKAVREGTAQGLLPHRYICFGIVLDSVAAHNLPSIVCNYHAEELALDYLALAGLCFEDAMKAADKEDAVAPTVPDDVPTVPDLGKKDLN